MVVDQLPYLWDFVLTGEMEKSTLVANRLLPPRAHTPHLCVADQGEANIGELAEQVLYFISPLTLFQFPSS